MPQLIIESPQLQPPIRRVGWAVITLGCWSLWATLLIPFARLLEALYRSYTDHGIQMATNLSGLQSLLDVQAIAVGVPLLAWIVWGAGRQLTGIRRKPALAQTAEPVSLAEMADSFGASTEAVSDWRTYKSVTVRFDQNGRILSADAASDEG